MQEHLPDVRGRPYRSKDEWVDDNLTPQVRRLASGGRSELVSPKRMLGLQRTAGNAAVIGMLDQARSPVNKMIGSGGRPWEPIELGPRGPAVTHLPDQRNFASPSATLAVQKQDENKSSTGQHTLKELIRITGDELIKSHGEYGRATSETKSKIRLRKENQADWAGLFVDVFFGALNPGLGRLLGGKLAKSEILGKVFDAFDSERVGELTLALTDPDTVKTYYMEAHSLSTKIRDEFAKGESDASLSGVAITGDLETDKFLDKLEEKFGTEVSNLNAQLSTLSFARLGVVYLAHRLSTKSGYAAVIENLLNQFKSQVKPIGESVEKQIPIGRTKKQTAVYNVVGNKHQRLALLTRVVRERDGPFGGVDTDTWFTFVSWISEEMRDIAIAKTKRLQAKTTKYVGVSALPADVLVWTMDKNDLEWLDGKGTLGSPGVREAAQARVGD